MIDSRPALCHSDLHEANVLVERVPSGWVETGVVDLGGEIAAASLFDLARTDYWSTRDDPEKRAGLREGHGEFLGRDQEAMIDIYALHHALELWNWFARAHARPRQGSCADQSSASPVDAVQGALQP